MDADDLKNIKTDQSCSDLVRDLEALGYVEITYDKKGEEFINITKDGIAYFEREAKKYEHFYSR